jgi:hypothetical protein
MMTSPVYDEQTTTRPEKGWPLALLAEMLKVGPPLLTEIIKSMESVEDTEHFVNLVQMLLPEYENEVMSAPRHRRVYKFCFYFGKKYYPLPANMDCPPAEWVDGMPVTLYGLSYKEYHELAMRPGYLLMLSLVVYPWEGDDRDALDDSVPFNPAAFGNSTKKWKPAASDIAWLKDLFTSLKISDHWIAPMGFEMVKVSANEFKLTNAADTPDVKDTIARTLLVAEKLGIKATFIAGKNAEEKTTAARIPLLDRVQNVVGAETVRKIPKHGWEPEDLHKMTDGTRFDGVADFADWACGQTGCTILDSSYEDCAWVEGMAEPIFKWTKKNVEILTAEWPKVQDIRQRIDYMATWLEQDQANHFFELVNFLMSHKVKPTNKHRMSTFDRGERACILDQATDYDEEENDGTG